MGDPLIRVLEELEVRLVGTRREAVVRPGRAFILAFLSPL